MSHVHLVPQFVLDALEDAAGRDAGAQTAWLNYQRWRAHTVLSPGLIDNVLERLDRARGELAQVARMISGTEMAQVEIDGLVMIVPGQKAQEAARREGRDTEPLNVHSRRTRD